MRNTAFIIFALFLTITSCTKEEHLETAELNQTQDQALLEKNKLIKNYASLLASSMENENLRSTIKQEAQQKFDGDYDILASTLEDKVLPNQAISVKELLTTPNPSSFRNGNGSTPEKDQALLEQVKATFPNLQVAVPVHCDNWDTKNYTPLVAFLPVDYDESTTQFITAFDNDGNEHRLSVDEMPDHPVIVVSISERVDEHGQMYSDLRPIVMDEDNSTAAPSGAPRSFPSPIITVSAPKKPKNFELYHGVANALILQWNDVANETEYEIWRMKAGESAFQLIATNPVNDNHYIDNGLTAGSSVKYRVRAVNRFGNSPWSDVMGTIASERNDGDALIVKKMKFITANDLKAVEKWPSGAPELRLRVVKGSSTGAAVIYTSSQLKPDTRDDIKGTWWLRDIPVNTSWDTQSEGIVYTFSWQEEDPIKNVNVTLNVKYAYKKDGHSLEAGGSVSFQTSSNGDIGHTMVKWWDDEAQFYSTGGFAWEFHH